MVAEFTDGGKFVALWKSKFGFKGRLHEEECRALVCAIQKECKGNSKKEKKYGLSMAEMWTAKVCYQRREKMREQQKRRDEKVTEGKEALFALMGEKEGDAPPQRRRVGQNAREAQGAPGGIGVQHQGPPPYQQVERVVAQLTDHDDGSLEDDDEEVKHLPTRPKIGEVKEMMRASEQKERENSGSQASGSTFKAAGPKGKVAVGRLSPVVLRDRTTRYTSGEDDQMPMMEVSGGQDQDGNAVIHYVYRAWTASDVKEAAASLPPPRPRSR